jgi:hypothetical protein
MAIWLTIVLVMILMFNLFNQPVARREKILFS